MARADSVTAPDSALGNVLRSLPRALGIVRAMRPTWHVRDPAAIDAAFLARHGIRGVLWDVDGTLTRFHDGRLAAEAGGWRGVLEAAGLRQAILSNAPEPRFVALAAIFPTLPILKGYRLGGAVRIRRRLGDDDSMPGGPPAGAVPVRKPDPALLLAAAAALDLPPESVVMIGDQYFTDIAGAGLAGLRSIKVATIGRESFPTGMRIGHLIERVVYRLAHGKPVSATPE